MTPDRRQASDKQQTLRFGDYEWRVLAIRDNKALLITRDAIEKRPYNVGSTTAEECTWQTCTLRSYLNKEFYETFSTDEQKRILTTETINKDNQWFKTAGGGDTADKLFLLSIEEVVNYFGDSGQLKNRNPTSKYFINDQYNCDRVARHANDNASCDWWLRSPGLVGRNAAGVYYGGSLHMSGHHVHNKNGGVRPALWLDLNS
jgi:hypothetical protein